MGKKTAVPGRRPGFWWRFSWHVCQLSGCRQGSGPSLGFRWLICKREVGRMISTGEPVLTLQEIFHLLEGEFHVFPFEHYTCLNWLLESKFWSFFYSPLKATLILHPSLIAFVSGLPGNWPLGPPSTMAILRFFILPFP